MRPPLRAILVHGLGRTPASMLVLAARLHRRGLRPALFGYSAAFEGYVHCVDRLVRFIDRRSEGAPFLVIGHSLGSVLLRSALPRVRAAPRACFFIAPPTRACRIVRAVAPWRLFRLATGEMGQLLADPGFMEALPVPACPTRIYAGTGGPVGRWSPFGDEPNDGILAVSETGLAGAMTRTLDRIHTFMMNDAAIADEVRDTAFGA